MDKTWLDVLCDVMRDLEVAMGACTLGMNDSFRNSFSVEFSKLVNQVDISQENGTSRTSSQRVLVIVNWVTLTISKNLLLHLIIINYTLVISSYHYFLFEP